MANLEYDMIIPPREEQPLRKRTRHEENELDFYPHPSKRLCEEVEFAFHNTTTALFNSPFALSEISNYSKEPTLFDTPFATESVFELNTDQSGFDYAESLLRDDLINEVVHATEEYLQEEDGALDQGLNLESTVKGLSERTLFDEENGISVAIGLKLAMSQFTGARMSKAERIITLDRSLPALGPLRFREGNFEQRGVIDIGSRREAKNGPVIWYPVHI
jgi:hypothetical protein